MAFYKTEEARHALSLPAEVAIQRYKELKTVATESAEVSSDDFPDSK